MRGNEKRKTLVCFSAFLGAQKRNSRCLFPFFLNLLERSARCFLGEKGWDGIGNRIGVMRCFFLSALDNIDWRYIFVLGEAKGLEREGERKGEEGKGKGKGSLWGVNRGVLVSFWWCERRVYLYLFWGRGSERDVSKKIYKVFLAFSFSSRFFVLLRFL